MKKDTINEMNVEKNKELFEYEMTEVILKLKGEFAVVSGKDSRYKDVAVDQTKLDVSVEPLPKVGTPTQLVSVPNAVIDLPIPEKSFGVTPHIVKLTKVLSINIASIPNCAISKADVVIPNVQITKNIAISRLQIKTAKATVVPTINATPIKNKPIFISTNNYDVVVPQMPTISIRPFAPKPTQLAEDKQPTVSIKVVKPFVKPIASLSLKTRAVKLPRNISPHLNVSRTVMTPVGQVQHRTIDAKMKIPDDLPAVKVFSTNRVVPETQIAQIAINPVTVSKVGINAPKTMAPQFEYKPIDKSDNYRIPDIDTTVKTNMSIPPIIVRKKIIKTGQMQVDYQSAIDEILASAIR